MQNKLFEAALGVEEPWYVKGVDFDAARRTLTIVIDFVAGSRFELRRSRFFGQSDKLKGSSINSGAQHPV